jgi:hypothetical protein
VVPPGNIDVVKREYFVSVFSYGNIGCGDFKGGIQNQKGFWLKINCGLMKLLNFENWRAVKKWA